MKTFRLILVAICAIFSLAPIKVNGQVSIIGHAIAEVVTISNISSDIITELSIDSVGIANDLIFGTIIIKAKNPTTCDIVVSPHMLVNQNNALNYPPGNNTPYSNSRTLNLTGNASIQQKRLGINQGSYNIVLAYN